MRYAFTSKVCPTCGRKIPMTNNERQRKWKEKHRNETDHRKSNAERQRSYRERKRKRSAIYLLGVYEQF